MFFVETFWGKISFLCHISVKSPYSIRVKKSGHKKTLTPLTPHFQNKPYCIRLKKWA